MLGKLYKYEFRRIGKVACLLLAVFLGVTVVGSIYLVSPLFHSIIDSGKGYNRTLTLVSGILGIVGLLVYVILLIGLSFGFLIYLGVRFYRSMYSDEGYLTHTLPVKASSLITVKMVTAGALYFAVLLALYVMVGFLFMLCFAQSNGMSIADVMSNLGEFIDETITYLRDEMDFSIAQSVIIVLVSSIITPFSAMCILFGSITLGQYSWKNKGPMGIVAYVIVRTVMGFTCGILNIGFNMLRLRYANKPEDMFGLTNDNTLVNLFVEIFFSLILYFWSIHIVKNRLNME